MSISTITREMDERERARFTACKEQCRRLATKDGHWEDWLVIGDGLMALRAAIMRLLHITEPKGSAYNADFGKALRQDTDIAHIKPAVCSHLLFCLEHQTTTNQVRADMTPAERIRITHPTSMYKRVHAIVVGKVKRNFPSVTQRLKIERDELTRQNADLAEKLAAAEHRDGSLFDLHRDTAEEIAKVIVAHVSPNKARAIHHLLGQAIASGPKPKPPKLPKPKSTKVKSKKPAG
jgi:hypothetical protein